jgi:hypothetical protein
MDRLFYNSILTAQSSYYKQAAYNAIKMLLLIAFVLVELLVLKNLTPPLQTFVTLGIIVSLLHTLMNLGTVYSGYRDKSSNNITFLVISEMAGHSSAQ